MNVLRDLIGAMCLVVIGAAGLQARGDVLAYDGFDYPEAVGTSIAGLNGGTGWIDAYPTPSGTIALANDLSFSGFFPSTGKSMDFGLNANMTTDGRNWSATASSGTYWYSMLARPQIVGSNRGRGTFFVLQGVGDSQNGFGFRIDDNAGSPQFKAWTRTQAAGANIDFSGGYDQTYVVLGKLTVDTALNTTSALWVYGPSDTLPATEPSTPMSSQTQVTGSVLSAIGGRAFSNSGPLGYDEIRVGTTFADVMPVPEPASVAAAMVAGLGGLGLLARRRFRRNV